MSALSRFLALTIIALAVGVLACGRKQDAAPAPVAATAKPAAAPARRGATPASPAAATAPAVPSPPLPAPTLPSEPSGIRLVSLAIGKSRDANGRITTAGDTFRGREPIEIWMETSGTGKSGLLAARLLDSTGRVVGEASQGLVGAESEPSTFTFSTGPPRPPGRYRIEIRIDGEVASTREISVVSSDETASGNS